MHSSPLLKVSLTSSGNNIGMTLPKSQVLFFFFFKQTFFLLLIHFWPHWVFVASWAFSSCSDGGYPLAAVRTLFTAVASLIAEHGL